MALAGGPISVWLDRILWVINGSVAVVGQIQYPLMRQPVKAQRVCGDGAVLGNYGDYIQSRTYGIPRQYRVIEDL